MTNYEYKVVPAPHQGTKAKGVKSTEDRFSLSLTNVLNEMAAEGWTYLRAETLPCDERKGLTGTQTTYQNVLVFQKATETKAPETAPEPLQLRAPTQPTLVTTPAPAPAPSRDEPPLRRFSHPPEGVDDND